jgi:hypothetical protein
MIVWHIRDLLGIFEKGTGQCLSPAKCSLLVRDGADQDMVDRVKSILNVNRVEFEAKYLGLPMPEGNLTGGVFKSIEERYVKRMSDWREHTLSHVAKEVLIKSVAQALPTYMVSVFKIPFGICDALKKHTRAFWWGVANGKRKMQWIPWEVLVKPKIHGGMGLEIWGCSIKL